jgi:hypothetical protein
MDSRAKPANAALSSDQPPAEFLPKEEEEEKASDDDEELEVNAVSVKGGEEEEE